MNPDPTTPTADRIPAGIRCGCGWSTNLASIAADQEAHYDHIDVCPSQPPKPSRSWAGDVAYAVFSFWGAVIAILVATAFVTIYRR